MSEKFVSSIDVSDKVDNIDINKDNLKKALRAMPTSVLTKIDIDNKITELVSNLDKNIQLKIENKLNWKEKFTPDQEKELDLIVSNLSEQFNILINNYVKWLDVGFSTELFDEVETMWMNDLNDILDWIKFYEKTASNDRKVVIENNTDESFSDVLFKKFASALIPGEMNHKKETDRAIEWARSWNSDPYTFKN